MPRDWKTGHFNRLRARRSERGRKMANRRWQIQRQREAELAAMDPIKLTGRIIRRIVVIDHERDVRECVFTDLTSRRQAAAQLRQVLQATP
jgi:hypothetical protein